jgi:hypothetical protein
MRRRAARNVLMKHGQFVAPRAGDVLVTAAVGPAGEAVALWAAAEDAAALHGRHENAGGASFPDVTLPQPVEIRATVHTASRVTQVISIGEFGLAHPNVQPMPDGELLIVGSRCAWTAESVRPNAALYGADGSLHRTAVVGDGVQHVRSTPVGEVWIGYSDEGIYGNFGWGGPGPAPIGRSGLARFDADLNMTWEYPSAESIPRIDDFEALNVATDVWACYYSDYPLARIQDGSVRTWRTGLTSASALLVDDDRVAFFGSQATFGRIEGDNLRVTGNAPLALPRDASARGTQLIGQGPKLNVLTPDGTWYVGDLDSFAR